MQRQPVIDVTKGRKYRVLLPTLAIVGGLTLPATSLLSRSDPGVINANIFHIGDVHFAPDGKSVLCVGTELQDDSVWTWRWNPNRRDTHRRLGKHAKLLVAFAISDDEQYALTGAQDHKVCLWELATGRRLHEFEGHSDGVKSVAFSTSGRFGVSVAYDHSLCVWDLKAGKLAGRINTGDHVMHAVFSPDGREILSVGSATGIEVWSVKSAQRVRTFGQVPKSPDDLRPVSHDRIAFSANGKTVCTANYSRICIYDFETGRQLHVFDDDFTSIYDVAFSPDNRLVASAGRSQTVYIWDIATGALVRKIEGGGGSSVSFSPDSKRIAVCHDQHRSVSVYSVATGEKLAESSIADSSDRLRGGSGG